MSHKGFLHTVKSIPHFHAWFQTDISLGLELFVKNLNLFSTMYLPKEKIFSINNLPAVSSNRAMAISAHHPSNSHRFTNMCMTTFQLIAIHGLAIVSRKVTPCIRALSELSAVSQTLHKHQKDVDFH